MAGHSRNREFAPRAGRADCRRAGEFTPELSF